MTKNIYKHNLFILWDVSLCWLGSIIVSRSLMDGLDTNVYSLVNPDFTSGVKSVL